MTTSDRNLFFFVSFVSFVVMYLFDPATTWWFPSCPLRSWTGWLCPACGSLRALHALLHGSIGEALRLNPMTTIGAIGAVSIAVHDWLQPARSWRLAAARATLGAPGVACLAAFTVLRNLK